MNKITTETKLNREFSAEKTLINPDKLRRRIIESILQQGFVIDSGNGIVAENYEEYEIITRIINELRKETHTKVTQNASHLLVLLIAFAHTRSKTHENLQ